MYQITITIFDKTVEGKKFEYYADAEKAKLELEYLSKVNNFPAIHSIVKI